LTDRNWPSTLLTTNHRSPTWGIRHVDPYLHLQMVTVVTSCHVCRLVCLSSEVIILLVANVNQLCAISVFGS